MNRMQRWQVVLIILAVAATAAAQMPMQGPPRFRGVWSPVVGSGAAYAVETKGEPKRELEIAIVGTEKFAGKDAHWLEMVIQDPEAGQVIMKNLVVPEGQNTRVTRMIFQMEGQPPMEMAGEMMGMPGARNQGPQDADIRDNAVHVGTETVTTPAGTFTCDHYRAKDGTGDVWVDTKVAPWGLVKMSSPESTVTLQKVLTNVKTRIRGTPRKFDMGEMMRQRPE